MNYSDGFSRACEALSDPYRRQLLFQLLGEGTQADGHLDPLNVLDDDEEDVETLQTEIVHNHVPKLVEMKSIERDEANSKIGRGPRWNELVPLLRLIDSHRDELPEDWF